MRNILKPPPALTPILAALALLPFLLAGPAWGQEQAVFTRSDVTIGAVAAVICPVNSSRVACTCSNNDAAVHARVGDSLISPTRGVRMPAGAITRHSGAEALFAISEGAAIVIACTDASR